MEINEKDYKIKHIHGGQYDGMYEITYKGSRIEIGGPFITRKIAIKHMQLEIADKRTIRRLRNI